MNLYLQILSTTITRQSSLSPQLSVQRASSKRYVSWIRNPSHQNELPKKNQLGCTCTQINDTFSPLQVNFHAHPPHPRDDNLELVLVSNHRGNSNKAAAAASLISLSLRSSLRDDDVMLSYYLRLDGFDDDYWICFVSPTRHVRQIKILSDFTRAHRSSSLLSLAGERCNFLRFRLCRRRRFPLHEKYFNGIWLRRTQCKRKRKQEKLWELDFTSRRWISRLCHLRTIVPLNSIREEERHIRAVFEPATAVAAAKDNTTRPNEGRKSLM